jgi:2,5-diketo-D-gluconate reductase A
MLGLGVWQVPNGAECVNAVRWALDLGYRHIDTAQAYGNEKSVGRRCATPHAARPGIYRDQVLSATQRPVAEAQQSLRRLGVDQVDLYLVHWPQGGRSGPGRVWSALASWDTPLHRHLNFALANWKR